MMRLALRQIVILLLLAALPAAISAGVQMQFKKEPPLLPGEVRPATARQWGEYVLYVDARPAARYEAGHIPNAVRLTPEEWDDLLPKFLDGWNPDRTIVVYCDGGSCEDSRAVADRLKGELQIDSVFILKGGWPAWQKR